MNNGCHSEKLVLSIKIAITTVASFVKKTINGYHPDKLMYAFRVSVGTQVRMNKDVLRCRITVPEAKEWAPKEY